jgi:hypothetical protein
MDADSRNRTSLSADGSRIVEVAHYGPDAENMAYDSAPVKKVACRLASRRRRWRFDNSPDLS